MLSRGYRLIGSRCSGNRFQLAPPVEGKGIGLNEAVTELHLDETYLTSEEVMCPSLRASPKY